MSAPDARVVSIFRLHQFKVSETFIRAQASKLSRYAPVYTGRIVLGSSNGAPLVTPRIPDSPFLAAVQTLGQIAFRSADAYADRLRSFNPSLIHAHFSVDGVYALPLSRKLNVPLVVTLHGYDVTRSSREMLRSFRPALVNGVVYRRALQRDVGIFVCVSKFIMKRALDRGYPEEKLRCHYIGVDTAAIQPAERGGDDRLVVHVGRLVEQKGCRYLLRSMTKLVGRYPDIRLVVIGDGPARDDLMACAKSLGVADRVSFLGAMPHRKVLDWLARAAVCVVPSIRVAEGDEEGLGIVCLEAAALGTPVIGFDTGGISEAIVHSESGFLVPERDVDGLAHYLSLLLSDADLRRKMGARGRLRMVEHFDLARQTARLEEIYDEALEGRK